MQRLSRQILDMSRLLGEDAGPNMRAFARAMNQFQEPVQNANVVLDQLFKITQDTGIAFGALLDQLLRQGPAFAPLNLSLIKVADLMGRFHKAGLRTRSLGPALLAFFAKAGKAGKKTGAGLRDAAGAAGIAATNFRSLASSTGSLLERSRALAAGIGQVPEELKKAADGAKKAMAGVAGALKTPTQAFEEIVRKIALTGDKLKQISIASEAFGVDAAGVIVEAIRQGIIPALDELGKPLENVAGLIKKTTDETKTLGDVMKTFGNDFALAFEPVSLALDKLARESVPALKRFTVGLAEFVAFLVEFGSRASAALGAVFDAIDPIKFGVTLNEAFPLWQAFIEGLIALFSQLGAFVSETFSQIVAAIGEAFAALSEIDFAGTVANILGSITGSFRVWGSNVLSIVGDTIQGVRSWLVDRFNAIVNSIRRAIARMVAAFRAARKAISGGSIVPDMVKEVGREFGKLDRSMVGVTRRQTGQVVSNFRNMAQGVVRSVGAGVLDRATTAINSNVTGRVPTSGAMTIRTGNSPFPFGFAPGGVNFGLFQAKGQNSPFPFGFAPGGVTGFQTGGSRVFTTPQLISVAETGPERITGEPLAGGRHARSGNNFVFQGPVMFDELSVQKFGREIRRVLEREDRRNV